MGLLDKVGKGLKDATGLGLDANEQYKRAYSKGVFIKDCDAASKNFQKAAEKFEQSGDSESASRSRANAAVYNLIATKDKESIANTIVTLSEVSEIEQLWSDQDKINPKSWIHELKAYESENIADISDDFNEKKDNYKIAGEMLLNLGTAPLTFADELQVNGPREKAMSRSYYYTGLSDYFGAHQLIYSVPSDAEDSLQKALMRFKQANDTEYSETVSGMLSKVKAKRHCWMCAREMQGEEFHFYYYPTVVQEFNKLQVQTANQDTGMLDRENAVTICAVCGTAIEKQADRYALIRAAEVRTWAEEIFDNHDSRMDRIESRLKDLERHSHKH